METWRGAKEASSPFRLPWNGSSQLPLLWLDMAVGLLAFLGALLLRGIRHH